MIHTNATLHSLTNDPERSANWAVIMMDETSNWRDDIAEKAGKIFGVYFVNFMEPTNLCSFDVNYPATFLYNIIENSEAFDEDELCELEMDSGGADFSYLHEYTKVDKAEPAYMPSSWFAEVAEQGDNWEEDQIEYHRCNHTF